MSNASTAKQERPVKRIVLVEDNPGDVHLLEKTLRARNIEYDLICYEDGEQAMQAMSSDHTLVPDLILLDLNLPRRDGFDVLGMVRRMPRFVGIPVGVLTSSNAAKDRSRTALIGPQRYIHKPPTLEEFIEQVGDAVEELLSFEPG